MAELDSTAPLPMIKPWLVDGFYWFCGHYLRKHFHAVAVDRRELDANPVPADAPLICYANHPSWWDPIIAMHLCRTCFPGRKMYAPIDQTALEKYRIFQKMGFYGIQLETRAGAASFLKTSQAILNSPNSSIWLTPEGRFADIRDRSATLMPGLAHLASRVERLYLVPVAIEYVFWEERLPEALQKLTAPIDVQQHRDLDKEQWRQLLEDRLRKCQDDLAATSIRRDTQPFQLSVKGKAGSWSIYDWCRTMAARVRGKKVGIHHGSKLN